jgi:hypothetical protein
MVYIDMKWYISYQNETITKSMVHKDTDTLF